MYLYMFIYIYIYSYMKNFLPGDFNIRSNILNHTKKPLYKIQTKYARLENSSANTGAI